MKTKPPVKLFGYIPVQVLAVLLALGGVAVVAEDAAKKPSPDHDKEIVVPLVGEKFGMVMTIEGEFVPKQNTYHDQNIVDEPYLLKVLTVDGKDLETPVTIEYLNGNGQVKSGVKYQMRAYETLYTEGDPDGWNTVPPQVFYRILHQLVIRDLAKAP